jgi:type I restriction enzyme S subunit
MILIKSGDLVISGINVAKGALGVYHGQNDVTATIHYSSYTFDKSTVSVEYFKRFLKSPTFIQLLKEQVKGGIKTEIKPKHLLPLEIFLPDKAEQLSILKQFQRIESEDSELKSELANQQRLFKKLRQQILQEAIEGKLTSDWRAQNPDIESASELLKRIAVEKAQLVKAQKLLPPISDEEKPFDLPQGWEWCRFQNVAEIFSNLVNPYDHYDLPHIAPNHIEKNTGKLLPFESARKDKVISGKHLFYPGQLLYSKVRPQLNKVAFAPCEGLCSADMYPIEANINPSYLQKAMLSQYFLDEVNRFDNRVKMPKINQNQFSSIIAPCPPLVEQQAIVTKVDKLLALCDQLETQFTQNQTHAEQLMQAVLKEVFTQI